MKFSLKANWEILLVLVIIAVGIVIITVAAIRKDKNPLALPDESDFGQLLHINSHEASDPGVSNSLGSNDKSIGSSFNSNGYPTPFEGVNQAQNSDLHEINNYHAAHLPSISTKSPYQINPIQSTYQSQADLTNRKDPTASSTDGSKRDSTGERHGKFEGFSVVDSLSDSYDAMSTEATPSQTRINSPTLPTIQNRVQPSSQAKKTPNNRAKNRANSTSHSFDSNNSPDSGNPLMDTVDLNFDDMQTTRGSIGNHQLNHDIGQSSPQADHQLVTLSAVPGHSPSNAKLDDSDELVTSAFSRSGGNGSTNNSTLDAQLNSAMMTNLFSSMQYPRPVADLNQLDNPDSQLSPSVNSNPNQFHSTRGLAGSMPLSMLLNDLIKMSKPYQPVSNGDQNSRDRGPQQNHGILQQLKSLPSPFLSLLQSLSPSTLANSVGSHGPGLTPSMTNNDASESNQYYQKISFLPSDFGSFLTRSMRSISAPLPAFPAPKGYVERVWNEAENPDQYQADQSVNADFVANNAAGFVRFLPNSNQQQQQQQPQQQSPTAYQKSQQQTDKLTPGSGSGSSVDQQQQAKAPMSNQPWSSSANSESSGLDNYNRQIASVGTQQGPQLSGGPQNLGINAGQPMTYQAGINYYQRAMNPNNLGQLQTSQQAFNNHRNQYGQVDMSPIINQQNSIHNVAQLSNLVSEPSSVSMQQNVSPLNKQLPTNLMNLQQNQQRQVNMIQSNVKLRSARRKRSMWRIVDDVDAISERIDALPEEDQDADSPPMSIVSPDGRPMDSIRLAAFPAQSYDNRYMSHGQEESTHNNDAKISRAHRLSSGKRKRPETNPFELEHAGRDDQVLSRLNNHGQMSPSDMSSQRRANALMAGSLETASSGLMGKLLLGKASTIDEMDDDLNDDDESPSEKRKEELEDAEFGIVNPKGRASTKRKNRKRTAASQRSRSATRSSKKRESQKKSNQPNKMDESNKNSVESTGVSSDGLYAKKNQQRSDIEFYGHPGEETRQLKYGILGSGNYEVYNGGVYAENDELASAVNSVANYARKPSNALALKLLGAEPLRLNHIASAGSRLNGLMRGASALTSEGEQAGLLGLMPNDLTASDKSGLAGNPLLDLIYPASPGNAGNHLLDSSLMSQLGSNTRSVHTDQQDQQNSNDRIRSAEREPSTKADSFGINKTDDNRVDINENEILSHTNRKQRRKGSKPVDSNQFNSYVISPSKKVNIFSDTDLDSAPSDQYLMKSNTNPDNSM